MRDLNKFEGRGLKSVSTDQGILNSGQTAKIKVDSKDVIQADYAVEKFTQTDDLINKIILAREKKDIEFERKLVGELYSRCQQAMEAIVLYCFRLYYQDLKGVDKTGMGMANSDDFRSEANECFFTAVEEWRPGGGSHFLPFLVEGIKRRIFYEFVQKPFRRIEIEGRTKGFGLDDDFSDGRGSLHEVIPDNRNDIVFDADKWKRVCEKIGSYHQPVGSLVLILEHGLGLDEINRWKRKFKKVIFEVCELKGSKRHKEFDGSYETAMRLKSYFWDRWSEFEKLARLKNSKVKEPGWHEKNYDFSNPDTFQSKIIAQSELNLAEIGRIAGVSRERMRQKNLEVQDWWKRAQVEISGQGESI